MVVCIGNSMGQGTLVWGSHGIEKAHVNARVKANLMEKIILMPKYYNIYANLMQKIILKRNFYNIYAILMHKNNFKAQFL